MAYRLSPPHLGSIEVTNRKDPLPASRRPDIAAPSEIDFLGVQVAPSVLGTDAPVTGKLSFSAPTRIDGVLRGEIRATELLVVGERGSVDGVVRARQLVILGEVRGEIRGADRVEVGPAGRLLGNVETRTLVISPGGIFDGDCRMPLARL
jgi:cytoskeletal protein CcmA (bactofilin family)